MSTTTKTKKRLTNSPKLTKQLTEKFKKQCLKILHAKPNRIPDKILSGSWLGKCLLCHEKEVGEIYYHNKWGNDVEKIGVSTCCDGRICERCEKELKPKRNLRNRRLGR